MRNKNLNNTFFYPALIFLFAVSIGAQTTEFKYQGKLTDNGSPASGGYLLQFKLFDAVSGGTQIGTTISDIAVTATNGVFATQLDFGVTPFNGADRFLEIAVKKNAGDSYTVLNPRQQITSSPYSIRTLSAAQADVALDSNKLGGVDANQYVTTSSVGNSFIKNSTTTQTADFNISGNGIVGGNLGIGTTTPRAKFHVVGSSWFQGDSTPLPAAAGKGIVVGFGGEQGYIQAFDYGAFTPKNLLLNNSGGNVGIGTLAPNSRLTVAGLIETTTGGVKFPDGTIQTTAGGVSAGTVILNQTTPQSSANFNIDGNGTVGGTLTANNAQVTGNGFVLGNFGIGTNAPAAKLDVRGGNILLDTPGSGIILKSPDGNTCRLLTVSDAGAVALTPITCP